MPENAEPTPDAAKPASPPPKPKPKPPAKPARELPSEEQLSAWVAGEDLPSLSNLFNLLNTKLFDAKVMQIKKQELLPQHWQVISAKGAPPDERFDALPEVRRLAGRYDDPAVAERRLDALRTAWRELRGKRPSLWNASDVFAAMRRIVDRKLGVDFHELLSAVRDVWRDQTYPQGREQLEVMWACLDFVRSKTKK